MGTYWTSDKQLVGTRFGEVENEMTMGISRNGYSQEAETDECR